MALIRFTVVFLFLHGLLAAQDEPFFINGAARQVNDSCFQLTTAEEMASVGSIWHPEKVNLRNSFDLVMEMNFGCVDLLGADGIVFGLQPVSASIGQPGEGLGIGGIRPALGVEFDTYENVNRLDPAYDHVAVMANGAVTHSGADNLAGPVRARAGADNIETCTSFPLRVTWDAPATTLRVYFDCELRLEYTGDIVTTIFGGDPLVYYGFAAATGGFTNDQQVCFTFNSFADRLADVTVCPGGRALLEVSGGESYAWSPAAGLSDPTAASVEASPDTTTLYSVKIFDACGLPLLDTVRVTVAGDSAFIDLGSDTTLCPGESLAIDVTVPTATYAWSDGSTRGAVATLTEPGTYTVTATRTDTACTTVDRLTLDRYTVPELRVPADTSLCDGQHLRIAADFPDARAYTDDGVFFDTLDLQRTGRWRITLEHPCVVQYADVAVTVASCRAYYVPTAFSPDGNGTNDRVYPQSNGDLLRIHRFAVYDRWGGLAFDGGGGVADDPGLGWDGRVGDRPAAAGAYVWVLDADFRDGSRRTERGSFVLIR
ncbi:lectin-like domain-containing protein [Lewinella sp. IMCC34183]|uniref:lectin-like domain-containing protein n=1 Tax=Lewinella sp. IMCC34183 TaxID=2248762 RepID=UPI000E232E40|nr:gliding motility-associated C-terminal domain-containing protein [Lewinella sp. IMCC34183]